MPRPRKKPAAAAAAAPARRPSTRRSAALEAAKTRSRRVPDGRQSLRSRRTTATTPAKKRKREAPVRGDDNTCVQKTKKARGRPKTAAAPVAEQEEPAQMEDEDSIAPEAARFIQLLKQDAQRLPPPPPLLPKTKRNYARAMPPSTAPVSYFKLPFKASEIASLEARPFERRPPPYGKINRCVYVSTTMPVADLPVHKCACWEETHKSTTKRASQMASAKARRQLDGASVVARPPITRHADLQRKYELEHTTYCGEGCHNRILFISCSDDTCSAPDPSLCSNRAIQRRELKSVRVEYIPGPGFGLFANEKVRAGEFIIEYVGEVIDDEECERRLIKYRDNGETHFYMLELEKNIVIDARYRSNESRFINHSCDPNSVTQKWNVGGIQRIGIFARRNIAPNEEITIDYNFSHFGEDVDCKCGSTACTGKIGRKRSEVNLLERAGILSAKSARARKNKEEALASAPPPELKRPVHVSSLALLKSAQLDESWLHLYGFKKRRLFLSHERRQLESRSGSTAAAAVRRNRNAQDSKQSSAASSSASSPVSEWSSTTEEDLSIASSPSAGHAPAAAIAKLHKRRNWYEKVAAGDHLPEMRALHSYICGGKADWTADMVELWTPPVPKKRRGRPPKIKPPPPPPPPQRRVPLGTKLVRKRLNLLDARSRCAKDLVAFANGKSKWNKQVAPASAMDPERITRFVEHVNDSQIFQNADQNDLNEDACYRCGLAGELICCDGCPAAFHLNCTNLAMVPPDAIPWFCSECTNPTRHHGSQATVSATASGRRSTRSGHEPEHAGRQLRTHAAPLVPSLKKIFHSAPAELTTRRRYKKRQRAVDKSYRLLEHMPLPAWDEAEESDAESE